MLVVEHEYLALNRRHQTVYWERRSTKQRGRVPYIHLAGQSSKSSCHKLFIRKEQNNECAKNSQLLETYQRTG